VGGRARRAREPDGDGQAPCGQLTVDLDGTGAGRLVRDAAPSVGTFSLALDGDVGPWLRWSGTDRDGARPRHLPLLRRGTEATGALAR